MKSLKNRPPVHGPEIRKRTPHLENRPVSEKCLRSLNGVFPVPIYILTADGEPKGRLMNERWFGSPGRTRTADQVVNSHPLYRLSYRGVMRASAFFSAMLF